MDIASVQNTTSSPEDKDSFRSGSSNSSSSSYTKHLERQIIRAWKRITRVTRKQHRYSFLPDDFVLVTARKRRSVLFR